MKRIGVRYAPETVEELSGLVRETSGPIVFGVGREHHLGYPTAYRSGRSDQKDQIQGAFENQDFEDAVKVMKDALRAGEWAGTELVTDRLQGIIDFVPEDQVVTVRSGTGIPLQVFGDADEGVVATAQADKLQYELGQKGQCLPYPARTSSLVDAWYVDDAGSTVGADIALNFPHSLQTQCGSWRDWVLGMTVVLADGTIVKTGSKAVKSVAGYDVHKLMIGAYDTLGIVVDVTLRTFPLKALPEPDLTWGNAQEKFKGDPLAGRYVWRQRVLQSHYQDALSGAGDNLLYADNAGCTLWCWLDSPDQELPRYRGDWVVRTGCGEKNVQITDPTQIRFMKRAKQIFDPEGKLNPGEFGFL